MVKKLLIVLGLAVLVLAVAGGAFYGGMLFQQSQAASVQARFFADRGGTLPGDFPGGAGGPGGQATFGEIKSIDGNTVTLSTPQSEVKVTLSDSTTIQKLVDGAPSDLQVGERISVRGERDSAGNLTAESIQITAGRQGP